MNIGHIVARQTDILKAYGQSIFHHVHQDDEGCLSINR